MRIYCTVLDVQAIISFDSRKSNCKSSRLSDRYDSATGSKLLASSWQAQTITPTILVVISRADHPFCPLPCLARSPTTSRRALYRRRRLMYIPLRTALGHHSSLPRLLLGHTLPASPRYTLRPCSITASNMMRRSDDRNVGLGPLC